MKIEQELKLDFSDVLIRPKRSTLTSRSEVSLERAFTFKHTGFVWEGIPVIAANMDTIGTFEMYRALKANKCITALHKHYSEDQLIDHFANAVDPNQVSRMSFYSMGITDRDYEKFRTVMTVTEAKVNEGNMSSLVYSPIKMVCVDVANGYTEAFVAFIQKLRCEYPNLVIMAGNVVTADMTEQLLIAGADIVKVGIGPGSVCTTRKMTGVGYPQLSAIIECADAAHGLGGQICADGGCTVPGDLAKAFGAGADFVMLGGMLSGHDESAGKIVEIDGQTHKQFYGMSSETAMDKHSGGVAAYKASEGKTVSVPYRGPVDATIKQILGGIRSACTYVGAKSLKELSKRTTFVRVSRQLNEVFGKSE